MRNDWLPGNRLRLLENGEAFFPRVFEAIRAAREEVLIETFILFDDKVGRQLREVLIEAASRGVQVRLTVDGYGSPGLAGEFADGLLAAGVVMQVFDPKPMLFGMRRNLLRRLHRKLVVIDGRLAFIGGINYSADHLADFGPGAKQDYSVEVEGPIVAMMHAFASGQSGAPRGRWLPLRARFGRRRGQVAAAPEPDQVLGPSRAMFVLRDNDSHPNDIERAYRLAIRSARKDIVIANAYFFPGYGLLREMRRAARRGVTVSLILQGEPDMPIAKLAARTLYQYLMGAGVNIYEYCERPLHGKVAVVDDEWATIGSSNLDPLSLTLNLEANLVIQCRQFNRELRASLDRLRDRHCTEVNEDLFQYPRLLRFLVRSLLLPTLRRLPSWVSWLPEHRPRIDRWTVPQPGSDSDDTAIHRQEPA